MQTVDFSPRSPNLLRLRDLLKAFLIRHASASMLLDAFKYREGNDGSFWIREESARHASRLLGIPENAAWARLPYGPASIIERDIRGELVRHYLAQSHIGQKISLGGLLAPRHWKVFVQSLYLDREKARRCQRIAEAMKHPAGRPLEASRFKWSGSGGLFLAPRTRQSERILSPILETAGKKQSLMWINFGPAEKQRDHKWGKEITVAIPSVQELAEVAEFRHRYFEAQQKIKNQAKASGERPEFINCLAKCLPEYLYSWLAAEFLFKEIFAEANPNFLFSFPEHTISAKTWIGLAHTKKIPTFTYWINVSPGYKHTDWRYCSDYVFTTGDAQISELAVQGFPKEQAVPVGSTLFDQCLESAKGRVRSGSGEPIRLIYLTKASYKSFDNKPVLDSIIESCCHSGLKWHLSIKRNPQDSNTYADLIARFPGFVTVVPETEDLSRLLAQNELVITGGSNAVWEALAAGCAVFVTDWTGTHTLERYKKPELKDRIWVLEDRASFENTLARYFQDRPAPAPTLPDSIVKDYFCATDGRSAERIASFL